MWRRWLIILATLLLLAALQLGWRQLQQDSVISDDSSSKLQYRMQDFTMRIIAADGSEQMRITAPLLIDQGKHKPSRLTRPVVTSMDSTQGWQISADRALLDRHNDVAEFIDNVVVNRRDDPAAMQLETSYLRFNLENKTIHSQELVTITRPGLLLLGTGLRGDINTARYQLLSNIQATYDEQ